MALSQRWLPRAIALLVLSMAGCGDGDPLVEEEPVRELAAMDYCDCMFLQCHDLYHDVWGSDEGTSRQECLREAEATPHATGAAVSGDSIECRLHYCENEPTRNCAHAAVQTDICR